MKQINSDYTAGSQIVVFDQVDATYVGGAHVDTVDALTRFTDKVIPAGTLVVPHTNGTFKVLTEALTAVNVVGAIGLTAHDVVIDDMPLVAVVMAGTVRKDALPSLEKAGVAEIVKVLPRLSFY